MKVLSKNEMEKIKGGKKVCHTNWMQGTTDCFWQGADGQKCQGNYDWDGTTNDIECWY